MEQEVIGEGTSGMSVLDFSRDGRHVAGLGMVLCGDRLWRFWCHGHEKLNCNCLPASLRGTALPMSTPLQELEDMVNTKGTLLWLDAYIRDYC